MEKRRDSEGDRLADHAKARQREALDRRPGRNDTGKGLDNLGHG